MRTAKLVSLFLVAAAMLVALTAVSALALSDQYETPPEQDPDKILDGKALGPGYAVLSPVRSNGLYRTYQLQDDQGMEQIEGDGLLKLRMSEIKAYVALEGLKTNTSFVDGLKQAAQKPAQFVESTIADPVGTARNTVTGVGRMIGRIGQGVEAAVAGEAGSPGEIAAALTGQAQARRELAVKMGVDPYTFDKVLSEKLNETASVTTAGAWTVNAITALLPGGMIIGATRAADGFRNLIADSTATELQQRATETFRRAGISEASLSSLLENDFYTLSEKTAIAYQLANMTNVSGLDILVETAAAADNRADAYIQLRRIVLLETYNRTISGLGQIRMVTDMPIAIRRDGLAAVVMPYDMVSWTEPVAQTFSGLHEGFGQLPFPPSGVDLLITGELTPMAAERIAAFGWQITGSFPMPDGPVH